MGAGSGVRPRAAKKSGFVYIKPAKRKASQYEEITLHTQWDPRNFACAGWFNLDKNGQPPWREDATLLKATDWWEFRDPNAEWFRPFVKRQADIGRSIEQTIAGAKRADTCAAFDPSWTEFLQTHYAAYRFAEYGLFLVLCQAQREAGSDVVAQPLIFQSVEKDRHAQDITLYCMELESQIEGFSDARAKDIWMNAPEWQGLRRVTEYLLACRDWGEIHFVVNCLLEPLVSSLICRDLILRNAPRHGDVITSVIAQAAESCRENNAASTKAFIELLLKQAPEHNLAVIDSWLSTWLPLVEQAAEDITPLFSTLALCSTEGKDALATVKADFSALMTDLGLNNSVEAAA
ncbi:hypothetical protein AB4876_09885 [Zhongshania guokunii]|uniref:Propane 2-monooxygenase n=1 Tax=Zhongshania guokunii TaxID=641783 RepID=A0ABV3U6Z2_9GAMM